jgi:hypothetical protein
MLDFLDTSSMGVTFLIVNYVEFVDKNLTHSQHSMSCEIFFYKTKKYSLVHIDRIYYSTFFKT